MTVEVNLQDVYGCDRPQTDLTSGIAPSDWQNWFQSWLVALYAEIPPAEGYEVTLRLTGDREIQSLNARYRDKDLPTDVLAFAALEVDSPPLPEELSAEEPLYLGDIIISLETADRQAQQQGHSLDTELVWLASHGFLHLLGWDHPDEDSLAKMIAQQETLLTLIGLLPQK